MYLFQYGSVSNCHIDLKCLYETTIKETANFKKKKLSPNASAHDSSLGTFGRTYLFYRP